MDPQQRRTLDEIARELDLIVFRLEQPPREELATERERLRRDLEKLRDRLGDLADGLF